MDLEEGRGSKGFEAQDTLQEQGSEVAPLVVDKGHNCNLKQVLGGCRGNLLEIICHVGGAYEWLGGRICAKGGHGLGVLEGCDIALGGDAPVEEGEGGEDDELGGGIGQANVWCILVPVQLVVVGLCCLLFELCYAMLCYAMLCYERQHVQA
jgi:hypothetical protein